MDLYDPLKYVHVLAAIAWVGGAILSQVHGAWSRRKADPQKLVDYIDFQAFLGTRYFAPLSGTVVLAGIGMVIVSGWNFTDTWILIGLVLFAISALTGSLYLGPESEKILAGLTGGGAPDAVLQKRIDRIILATRIDLVVLILVVADMVFKPGI